MASSGRESTLSPKSYKSVRGPRDPRWQISAVEIVWGGASSPEGCSIIECAIPYTTRTRDREESRAQMRRSLLASGTVGGGKHVGMLRFFLSVSARCFRMCHIAALSLVRVRVEAGTAAGGRRVAGVAHTIPFFRACHARCVRKDSSRAMRWRARLRRIR